ncbi:MAG: methylmalonyl-CoA mutase family protein [Chloroflexi bacterium]|nr:methylmalonyl-CoA mutase family protein [Chloroflexota bacterium]
MYDPKALERLRQQRERWEATTLNQSLSRKPERRDAFITESSRPIERLYTPLDTADMDYMQDIGLPGEYPFTRGVHATGHRGRLWTMRMFAGFGTAEETNRRFKYLLKQGNMGLSVAFDLPTLMGYDTDAPEALGEFGKCGVAVASLKDMEILMDDIPLDRVSTSMTINSPAAVILAYYIVAAEKQGVAPHQLRGTLQNDILKEFTAQKEFVFPPNPSMRLVTDTVEFATQHMPQWNTISVSGYHIREAGSTAAQELAFTLIDGMEYVRWAIERGLDVDDFAPRISFFFNVHNDFFEEIAKLRAARRIWAREMRETFGAKDQRSLLCRFHCQTAGVSLTAQQPEINITRVAIQALAAVLGGAQSLHTNSMDEALALPSEHAVKIALRTQQIIAHETGVTNTIDPLGGSFFVEKLTNDMEAEVREYMRRVDDFGGVIPAIEAGFFQQEIADAAFRHAQEVSQHERTIVGVNDFVDDDEMKIPILDMDPQGYDRQVQRLETLRRERDNDRARQALEALRRACEGDENTMPYLLECARAYCTLQETMDVMREVFGIHEEQHVI